MKSDRWYTDSFSSFWAIKSDSNCSSHSTSFLLLLLRQLTNKLNKFNTVFFFLLSDTMNEVLYSSNLYVLKKLRWNNIVCVSFTVNFHSSNTVPVCYLHLNCFYSSNYCCFYNDHNKNFFIILLSSMLTPMIIYRDHCHATERKIVRTSIKIHV